LPVQAGSNKVLKLMNRKYTREDYLEKIELLRKYIPDVSISTDIMVAFPTETEEDFLDTLDLVKRVKFSNAFTFVYSKRDGTPASKMDGQIEEAVAKDRIMRLIALQNEIATEDASKYVSKTVRVLCEDYDEKKNLYQGRDTNGKMVYFKGIKNDLGNFVDVLITSNVGISLYGDVVR
jgi:tRNA-2-methylthio-N6-dimethylallyladenosine synthase